MLRRLSSVLTVRFAVPSVLLSITWMWAAPALAAPAAINPCPLLAPAEISAVVGRNVGAGKFFDGGQTKDGAHTTTCLWTAPLAPGADPDPDQRLGGRGFVILNIQNWPNGPKDAQKFLDTFNWAFEHQDISSKPVAVNVGADQSVWWGDGVAGRKGGISFGISVAQLGDKATRQPRAESLARLLVKRLPAHPG